MLDNLNEPGSSAEDINDDLDTEIIEDDADLEAENDLEDDDNEDDDVAEDGESITLDGETITADEIREMQQGNLRQSDYTKKTTQLAKSREQIESLTTDLETSIKAVEDLLGDDSDSELDELLEDGDTAEYLRRDKLRRGKSKKLAAAKALAKKAFEDKQIGEGEALVASMPEWGNQKTGSARQKEDIADALSYAETLGFTNDDISKISDHRVMRALIDAGKLSKLKSKQVSLKKEKTKVKPSKKPANRGKPGSGESKSIVELFYGDK